VETDNPDLIANEGFVFSNRETAGKAHESVVMTLGTGEQQRNSSNRAPIPRPINSNENPRPFSESFLPSETVKSVEEEHFRTFSPKKKTSFHGPVRRKPEPIPQPNHNRPQQYRSMYGEPIASYSEQNRQSPRMDMRENLAQSMNPNQYQRQPIREQNQQSRYPLMPMNISQGSLPQMDIRNESQPRRLISSIEEFESPISSGVFSLHSHSHPYQNQPSLGQNSSSRHNQPSSLASPFYSDSLALSESRISGSLVGESSNQIPNLANQQPYQRPQANRNIPHFQSTTFPAAQQRNKGLIVSEVIPELPSAEQIKDSDIDWGSRLYKISSNNSEIHHLNF
jgi:hypothetical protein